MRRAVIIALFAASVALLGTTNAGAQSTVNVESSNLYFCDPSFSGEVCETAITAGDTVVWNNVEGVHTVTQCGEDFSPCPLDGGFDSGFLSPGDDFSVTFDTPGSFYYWCELHPFDMRGIIDVQAPTPSPSPTPAPTAEPSGVAIGDPPEPTPATTATPADVPATGADPRDTDMSWFAIMLVAGLGILAGGLGFSLALRRA